uniref:Uncharacterized protein n=1 Tax=Arundo donax TaxID=35708 RepID=A0A0A9ERA2_ARUDO
MTMTTSGFKVSRKAWNEAKFDKNSKTISLVFFQCIRPQTMERKMPFEM